MSRLMGQAVSEILLRYFGEIVQKVGDDLFRFGARPLSTIVRSTGLLRSQVIESLRALIKYDIVSFEPAIHNEAIPDYKLSAENVLLLIRYPKYLLQMKTKYGSEAELLVEELMKRASCTATLLLVTIANRHKDDKDKNISLGSLRDMFICLATAGYIQQAPVAEVKEDIDYPTMVPVATIIPDLDMRMLMQVMTSGKVAEANDNVYWKVNFDRFHLDFRDDIMIKAMAQRIDDNAGELMRLLLEQMYLSSAPWAAEGAPTDTHTLQDAARRLDRPLLNQYLEHYLKVLEENGAGFVRAAGGAGGGQHAVSARIAATALASATLGHLVTERLGSNAARIFRLICEKKYIEEDDIQKYAMLPNKECKQLTYKLMEEHFIHVQPMRKPATAGGLAKAIYLYHVKMYHVCQTVMGMTHSALHNCMRRARTTAAAHHRLLAKQRRVRRLAHQLRARGESQQHINDVEETLTPPELALLQSIERKLKHLSIAELALDKNLFILKWYFMYPSDTP